MTDGCYTHVYAPRQLIVDNRRSGIEQIGAVMEIILPLPYRCPNVAQAYQRLFELEICTCLLCKGLAHASESATGHFPWMAKGIADGAQPACHVARRFWVAKVPIKTELLSNTAVGPSIAVVGH